MICKNCGHTVSPNDSFCGECGAKIQQDEQKHVEAVRTHQPETVHIQQTPIINKEQLNSQSRVLVNEGKTFFSQAFKNHDQAFAQPNHFSPLLSVILIGLGLLIAALFLFIMLPSEINALGISKTGMIFKFIMSLLIFIAVFIAATFLLARFAINPALTFKKVLSDYVLINSFSFLIFLTGLLLIILYSYTFGLGIIFISAVLFAFSPLYLIGKYSSHVQPGIPSFYTIIIYILAISVAFIIFGESTITSITRAFAAASGSLLDGMFNSFNGY
ncbi:zinc-ribbon domain-containing protein [Macrococcus carouselicus]|uniref:Zinc-ribbon domain-containing protein n=1 Tax=Macrococcus carouselicus TaxID=69969 RepID=A0A9Q8CJ93_9STAP|nr:zinc-ribbon domain-containing protein [Macrococcus carouselicus]TDL96634.1 zinc-ribbon domain-containing protein [Macrococcus carouselicus]